MVRPSSRGLRHCALGLATLDYPLVEAASMLELCARADCGRSEEKYRGQRTRGPTGGLQGVAAAASLRRGYLSHRGEVYERQKRDGARGCQTYSFSACRCSRADRLHLWGSTTSGTTGSWYHKGPGTGGHHHHREPELHQPVGPCAGHWLPHGGVNILAL